MNLLVFTHILGVIWGNIINLQKDWQLVWHDEFDGDQLDYTKWGIEVNALGGGNNELQLYTDYPSNVRVESGNLILEARSDSPSLMGTKRKYSSGRIRTKNRGDWKYCYLEVKAKLPAGTGMWPAIWMLPTDDKYGTWPLSGEIDIVELDGAQPNRAHGTIHYRDKWPHNQSSAKEFVLEKGLFSDTYHVFAIRWEKDLIRWYIDGECYHTQTRWNTSSASFPAPFDQRFHLLLNLAVGGNMVDDPDSSTQFPQQMLIDYVRVYQRK